MDGDPCRLVDDDEVVVFVDYADAFGGYGRLVPVQGVRYNVAVS